jgi:hypothetical protein
MKEAGKMKSLYKLTVNIVPLILLILLVLIYSLFFFIHIVTGKSIE